MAFSLNVCFKKWRGDETLIQICDKFAVTWIFLNLITSTARGLLGLVVYICDCTVDGKCRWIWKNYDSSELLSFSVPALCDWVLGRTEVFGHENTWLIEWFSSKH